jgi:hypothetical protein
MLLNGDSGAKEDEQLSSGMDDLEESNELEQDENPDTKIVLDFFGGDIAHVESNSKDSNNEESGEDSAQLIIKKTTDEIPNHNGIISIENVNSQKNYIKPKIETSIIVEKAKLTDIR